MPEVEFQANGGTANGYLAEPESGKGPGLVVLQEWWGLVPEIKDVCDRFAAEGFLALAPDLYRGETTDQPDEAGQKAMALSMEQAEKDMRGAVDYLAEHDRYDGSGVGAVGWCLGGGLAVWAATVNPKVSAVVSYYYILLQEGKPDFSKVDAAVLGHFGTADEYVSVEDAKALEQELREGGADVSFEFYEGAGHAFFNETNRIGTYHEEHAESSWRKTLDFFRKHLRRGD